MKVTLRQVQICKIQQETQDSRQERAQEQGPPERRKEYGRPQENKMLVCSPVCSSPTRRPQDRSALRDAQRLPPGCFGFGWPFFWPSSPPFKQ